MLLQQQELVSNAVVLPAILLFSSPLREQGYGAFKVDDYDIVAARSKEDAIQWFLENWDVDPASLYPEPIEILLDDTINYVDSPDSNFRTVSYRELIRDAVNDTLEFPCIVATYEW